MNLRKANLADYLDFKKFFEDEEFAYQWMYYYPLIHDESVDDESLDWDDFSDFIEDYHNYTLERFRNDLELNFIFMIEVDEKVIGYVSIFYSGGVYRLSEWAMINSNDFALKKQILEEIKKLRLPRFWKLSVCTIHEPAIDFFLVNGFVQKPGYFLELELFG